MIRMLIDGVDIQFDLNLDDRSSAAAAERIARLAPVLKLVADSVTISKTGTPGRR